MITVGRNSIGIKATGTTASIPDHPMARLMYYLRTVNSLTDFNIPYNLRDYSSYRSLSFDEENQVLVLAVLLSPDLFIEKGIMINEPRLCPDSSNEFYEISAMQSAVAITEEFVIGGQKVHTLQIMAFKMSWMQNNYINPINSYSARVRAIANGTVESYRPRAITYYEDSDSSYKPKYSNDDNPTSETKSSSKCCLLI